jgi:hypothetical protein
MPEGLILLESGEVKFLKDKAGRPGGFLHRGARLFPKGPLRCG